MIPHLIFFLGVITVAALFALTEIQIEGRDGWAARLPTWRIHNRWTRLLYSGKPLTGYHLWMQLFVLAFAHCPYFMGYVRPSWPAEARILAFFIFLFITEDFLWFVLNPAFGLRRFRKEHIWWHAPHWGGIMPRDYWLYGAAGVALYVYSHMA